MRTPFFLIICAALICGPPLRAADTYPTLGGYEQVEIVKVEPDGLRITHKAGVAKLLFSTLPADIQKKYNYSPAVATGADGKKDGAGKKFTTEQVTALVDWAGVAVQGTISKVYANGVLLASMRVEEDSTPKAEQTYIFKTKWTQPKGDVQGPIFVRCVPKPKSSGHPFKAIIFPMKAAPNPSGGAPIPAWTLHPIDFTDAEGLDPLPAAALAKIQAKHPGFPEIPAEKATLAGAQAPRTGSGAAVGDGSLILTCAHVIMRAKDVRVKTSTGEVIKATVERFNEPIDLALLKLEEGKLLPPLAINAKGAEVGEDVFTLGVPATDAGGSELKLAEGKISGLSGFKDDPHSVQITAAVQPGNDGGALFNHRGELVAVASSKPLIPGGARAENVNFAIKVASLLNILSQEQKDRITLQLPIEKKLEIPELVKELRPSVVQVIAK